VGIAAEVFKVTSHEFTFAKK